MAVYSGRWKMIQNTRRPPGVLEFELFDWKADPLDRENLAQAQTAVVQRLTGEIERWREWTAQIRLEHGDGTEDRSGEELERLRALGYLQ